MKKLLGIILAVAMLATAFAAITFTGIVSATSPTITCDFETDADGWVNDGLGSTAPTLAVSDEAAHGGTKSLKITGRGEAYASPVLNLSSVLTTAGTYRITAYVKRITNSTAATPIPDLQLTLRNAANTQLGARGSVKMNQDITTWEKIQFDVTLTTEELASNRLCFDGLIADFYLDDVTVAPYTEPTVVDTDADGILSNGGAEYDTVGWESEGAGTIVSSDLYTKHSGNASFMISNRQYNWSAAKQDIKDALISGGAGNYTYSFWARLGDGETRTAVIKAYLVLNQNLFFAADSTPASTVKASASTPLSSTWQQISLNFTLTQAQIDSLSATLKDGSAATAAAAAPTAICRFDGSDAAGDDYKLASTAGATIYADDFLLEKIPDPTATVVPTAAPTAGSTVAPVTKLTCDFEDGTVQGWDNAGLGSPTFVASAEAAHGGTKSLKVTGRGDTYEGPGLDISTILANGAGEYKITAFVKRIGSVGDAAEPAVRMLFRDKTSLGSFLTAEGSTATVAMTNTTNDWVELTIDYTFTDADLKYNFLCFDSLKFDFYLDDVSVEKVIVAPDATATAKPEVKAFQYTVDGTTDLSDLGVLEMYFTSGLTGHYDAATDTATFYIMNTSDKTLTFQLNVGWDWGQAGDNMSCAVGEEVEIAAGAVKMITATNVSDYFAKTATDPFYDATVHLDGTSVVRLVVNGAEAGDTFLIAGPTALGTVKALGLASDITTGFEMITAPTALANLVLGITGEEGTADVATLGYAIAAISALGALAAGKRRFKK